MGDAAPLRDDDRDRGRPLPSRLPTTSTTQSKPTATTTTTRDPIPQKLNVLRTMIQMGALRPALMILNKFEWLPDAYPEVADLFLYIARISLSPLLQVSQDHEDLHVDDYDSPSPSPRKKARLAEMNAPLTSHRLIPSQTPSDPPGLTLKKRLLVPHAPLPTPNAYTQFVYFYPAWEDTIPLCTTREEITSVIAHGLLRFTGAGGANCARDVNLMTKLVRIGREEVKKVCCC